MKQEIYDLLSHINGSFDQIAGDLQKLEGLKIVPERVVHLCRFQAEEVRANANRRLTGILNTAEDQDAFEFGKKARGMEEVEPPPPNGSHVARPVGEPGAAGTFSGNGFQAVEQAVDKVLPRQGPKGPPE